MFDGIASPSLAVAKVRTGNDEGKEQGSRSDGKASLPKAGQTHSTVYAGSRDCYNLTILVFALRSIANSSLYDAKFRKMKQESLP